MRRIMKGMILFPLVFILAGCGIFPVRQTESKLFIAMQWNVQTLFDGLETGNEYAEFRKEAGWTHEKYQARITAISQAILQIEAASLASMPDVKAAGSVIPDLIGFIEVENAGVLKDFAGGVLSKYGYNWTAFTAMPGSSSGIGVLSRFPITDTKAHSITAGKQTNPRPALEVRVEPRGKPLVFLLCHWKSKLGNNTEALRRSSAWVVQRRVRELNETGTPVIVMGDLNENHDEFYRHSGALLCALLPDDPDAAALAVKAGGDFLVLSGEKPPRSSYIENVPALYSPWIDELEGGSYHYRGEWETIDHFLVSSGLFDGAGWDYSGFKVLNTAPFVSSKGIPDAYVPRYGRGLSDHLPLLLYLEDLED